MYCTTAICLKGIVPGDWSCSAVVAAVVVVVVIVGVVVGVVAVVAVVASEDSILTPAIPSSDKGSSAVSMDARGEDASILLGDLKC